MNLLESMRIFASVAECLNFSDAARQLGISNSAVTRGLAALETHLELRLISRTTRHVSLTPAGASYLEGCAELLLQLDRMEDRVRAESQSASGRLKLAVPALFAATDLPALLAAFRLAHPLVSFDLTVYEKPSQIVQDDYEVCIMIERKLRDSSLVCRSLGRSVDAIVAAPDYLHRRGLPVAPRDLSGHDVLLDAESLMRYWTFFDDDKNVHRVTLVPILSAQNLNAIVLSAIAGLGIARVPRALVGNELASGALVSLLDTFELEGGERTIWLLYPGQRHATRTARAFVEFAASRRIDDERSVATQECAFNGAQ